MTNRDLYMIAAACAAGYLGGVLSTGGPVKASPSEVVRASKFVLVTADGTAAATWEVDSNNNAHLAFLNSHRSSLTLGSTAQGTPFLGMDGRDGKNRISVSLDLSDKPFLVMSDDRWRGRVHLGSIPPDTIPYPSEWDQWGILFRAFGSERPVAGMGTMKTAGKPVKGFLTVSGKRIR